MSIRWKRAYAPAEDADGYRVLVDRLWPRGMKRDQLKLNAWLPDVAPSAALRQWFGHAPDKWPEFRRRYLAELADRQAALANLASRARAEQVTFIYAAKDEQLNNAVVLKEYLERMMATEP